MVKLIEQQTNAEIVYDALYADIVSMRLLPGAKVSEAEMATQFDLSRQPVRDAFSRLEDIGFLRIRPQRATEVKKFSLKDIASTRFIRTAIEVEVTALACANWTDATISNFEKNLADQLQAANIGDVDAFHRLDDAFHYMLYEVARVPFAHKIIARNKAQINRLCVLSMMDGHAMMQLVTDHHKIYDHVCRGDIAGANAIMRTHLTRLDDTIAAVQKSHPEYFT